MRLTSAVARRECFTAAALLALAPVWQPAAHATTADRVDPETGKLVLNSPPTVNVRETPPTVTARCYLDVSIGGAPAERLDIELYGELAPMAAENFRCLCTGEKGFGYVGSSFYKVLQGLAVQGGDVDGNGLGRSIYGPSFVHDNYSIMHNTAGLVSMVNTGVGGASGASDSRFLIQPIDDAGFLDGRYEAFGRVYNGLDAVRKLDAVRVGGNKKAPVEKIRIVAAGEYP